MEWLDNAAATRLVEVLGRLRKPLYDDPIVGQVARKHNLNVLFTGIGIAEDSKAPNYLIEMSKKLMAMAADIDELGQRGEVCLGVVKVGRLVEMCPEEMQGLIAQGLEADLTHGICLLLTARYLNQALAIKVNEENRQFGGH